MMMLLLFNLQHPTPPGFQVNHIPKGNLVCRCAKCFFFCTSPCVYFPAAVSRSFGCGACRGPACTLRRKLGPGPGFVARSLGVQSCGELTLFAGSLSAEPEPARPMETLLMLKNGFALDYCVPVSARLTSPQTLCSLTHARHNNSRASSFSLVMAMKGASACV